jgi:hypothetical protein
MTRIRIGDWILDIGDWGANNKYPISNIQSPMINRISDATLRDL